MDQGNQQVTDLMIHLQHKQTPTHIIYTDTHIHTDMHAHTDPHTETKHHAWGGTTKGDILSQPFSSVCWFLNHLPY